MNLIIGKAKKKITIIIIPTFVPLLIIAEIIKEMAAKESTTIGISSDFFLLEYRSIEVIF